MQQQQQSVWGGQSNIKGTGVLFPQMPQQTHPVVQNRGRNITSVCRGPLGLSASAWPPLQNVTQQQHQLQQQNNHGVSGMRAVFLGNPGGKRECAGTGVFLPRQIGTRTESRKKQGLLSSPLPAVSFALLLKFVSLVSFGHVSCNPIYSGVCLG